MESIIVVCGLCWFTEIEFVIVFVSLCWFTEIEFAIVVPGLCRPTAIEFVMKLIPLFSCFCLLLKNFEYPSV